MQHTRKMSVTLALIVGMAGALAAEPATAAVHTTALTAAALCPSATPTLSDLKTVFTDRSAVDVALAAAGFKESGHRVDGYPTIANHSDIYSDTIWGYTYDATSARAQETLKANNFYQGIWNKSSSNDVYDAKASTWWTYQQKQTPSTSAEVTLINAALARLGVTSIWLSNPITVTPSSLAAGDPYQSGTSNDLAAQASGMLTNLTSPTFTCTVSGQTATLGIAGTDVSGTLKVTTDATSGAVLSLSEHLLVPGTNGYEESVEASALYAAQPVAKPQPSISQHKFDVAVDKALQRFLVQSIVKAAKPKVKKQTTAAKRVKALRSVINARIKAFTKTYSFLPIKVSVSNVPNGIRLKLNSHTTGVTPPVAKIVVKGSKLVVTYL